MRAWVLSWALLAGACVSPTEANSLSVAQLSELIAGRSSEGDTVQVTGFLLRPCQPRSCAIAEDPSDDDTAAVSLAGGTALEADLAEKAGRRITLLGRVGRPAFYIGENGNPVVTGDRAPEFIPIEIID